MSFNEWKSYMLGDVCNYSKGRVDIDKITINNYISTENMFPERGGVIKASTLPNVNSVVEYTYGDTLISNIRPYFKKIWLADKSGGASNDVLVFKCDNKKVYNKYLYYFLSQDRFFDYVTGTSKGTKMPRGDKDAILKYNINLPSIQEQKAISKVLSDLDGKIEVNNSINDNLVEIANTLYTSWFIKFEPFFESEFIDTEYGSIPKELQIKKIEELQPKLETGKRPKGGVSGFDTGMPSIGAESVKGIGYFDYSKTKYVPIDYAVNMKKGIVSGYELLIYKDGGKPGYFTPNFSIFGEGFPFKSFVLNEHVFMLDFGDKEFNIFSYFHFQSEYIKHLLHTAGCKAAIPGINQKDILSLYIFSKDNPKVKEFCKIVSPMVTTILKNCKQNRELSQMRNLLLTKLMSGEIRVPIESGEN